MSLMRLYGQRGEAFGFLISGFADRYGVDRAYISTVLNGRRRVSGSLAKALGLRRVYVVE
jgi:transcriptional regulator with XRE-family HTH domain